MSETQRKLEIELEGRLDGILQVLKDNFGWTNQDLTGYVADWCQADDEGRDE